MGTLKCNFVNKLPRSGHGRLQWSRSSTRRRSPGGSRALPAHWRRKPGRVASAAARFQDGSGAGRPEGGMLRAALSHVPILLSRARPRGPGPRWLWGLRVRLQAAGTRRAWGWGWRRLSSEPGPGPAHYQLVYTCKVGPWRGWCRGGGARVRIWRATELRNGGGGRGHPQGAGPP